MKLLLLGVVLFSSVSSLASVHFLNPSDLPFSMQEKIQIELLNRCQGLRDLSWKLQEVSTEVKLIRIDQGQNDYEYKTVFSVVGKDDNGYPYYGETIVESVQYDMQNTADNRAIVSIKGMCL